MKNKNYFKSWNPITFITFKYAHYTSFIQWPLSNHSLIKKNQMRNEIQWKEYSIQSNWIYVRQKKYNNNPRNKILYIVPVFTTASIFTCLYIFFSSKIVLAWYLLEIILTSPFLFYGGKKTIVAIFCNDHSSLRNSTLMYDASPLLSILLDLYFASRTTKRGCNV